MKLVSRQVKYECVHPADVLVLMQDKVFAQMQPPEQVSLQLRPSCDSGWLVFCDLSKGRESRMMRD